MKSWLLKGIVGCRNALGPSGAGVQRERGLHQSVLFLADDGGQPAGPMHDLAKGIDERINAEGFPV
jgi:hypothetical protein